MSRAWVTIFVTVALSGACTGGAPGEGRVPQRLASGVLPAAVPSAVREAADGFVVSTQRLEERSVPGLLREECARRWADAEGWGDLRFFGAWLSTEGLSVTFVTRGRWTAYDPERRMRLLLACDALWLGERWRIIGGAIAPWPDDPTLSSSGAGLNLDSGRRLPPEVRGPWVAFLWVTVPPGTGWVLVDRGSFWLAYEARDGGPVRVSATQGVERGSWITVPVVYLSPAGEVLGRAEVEGAVGG